jgi:hypothetical protein
MNNTTTSWNDTQKLLAFIIVAAFILIIIGWLFFPPKIDAPSTAVLNTLVGTLGGFTGMVVTFYFGSSRSSTAKDSTIAALTQPGSGSGNGDGGTKQTPPTPSPPASPAAG